jgi:hypothetical protein
VVSKLCSLIVGGSVVGTGIHRYKLLYRSASLAVRTPNCEEIDKALRPLLDFIVAARAPRRSAFTGKQGEAVETIAR